MQNFPIATPDGLFLAGYSSLGLASLAFPHQKILPTASRLATARNRLPVRQPPASLPASIQSWHQATTTCLLLLLAGQPVSDLPPFDLNSGTEFQQSVWRALLRIPVGRTASYADIARAISRPKALRAVGSACGANPVPVLIPCHRVIASGGRLGGFSGGLHWKRLLLSRESSFPPANLREPAFDFLVGNRL
jgi:O-6-methylguanine DNA methyltransferase